MNAAEKYQRLQQSLAKFSAVAVAFSGGVDSTFLLQVAVDVLGQEKVLALTVSSALFPNFELETSQQLAKKIGVRQQVIEISLLDISGVEDNQPQRCYHCKKGLYSRLLEMAEKDGFQALLDGSNLDDLEDYRPGQQALKELQIYSPLLDAKLTKQEIRDLSKQLGLTTWDKAPFACLASRFPYGTHITSKKLQQVERCEAWLRKQGFSNYRVRYHDQLARIELPENETSKLHNETVRQQMVIEFKNAGFTYVTLDMQGYRTGSLNEVL